MTRTPSPPSYDRYHGNCARVVIDGRSIHLGKYNSEASHQKHRQLLAAWSAGQPVEESPANQAVSVAEVLEGYRRAIERACDRVSPAPKGMKEKQKQQWQQEHRWTPHRLHHTCGTVVREHFGLDGSHAILGHRNARVSEVYRELNIAKAARIAREIG